MVVVAGPRIDPASLPPPAGLEVLGFVPDLYRLLAAVRPRRRARRPDHLAWSWPPTGGRSCTSRCGTTSSRPSTCRTGWTGTARAGGSTAPTRPESLAAALAEEIGRTPDYRPVATDGAARAAERLAALL